MPIEWQRIVIKIIDMHKRIQFGVSIPDPECPKERLAIECCQDAIVEKSSESK